MADNQLVQLPVYMHVNYLEGVFPLDEIIARCAEAGFDGIELRSQDNEGKLGRKDYLEYAYEQTKRCGIGVTFGSANDPHNSNRTKVQESLNKLKELIAFASEKDISILNTFAGLLIGTAHTFFDFEKNGSACAGDSDWRQTVDYFQQVSQFAADKEVTLCLETHNGYIHDLGEPTAKLLDKISSDRIKANLDYGNMYLNKNSKGMDEEVQALAGKIGYVHLKNLMTFRPCFDNNYFWATSLNNGDINNYRLVKKIFETGYRGIFTIECAAKGDKRHLMTNDLEYIRSLILELATRLPRSD